MDYKLDYMERLFAKISKKKTESYVISRLWHQLNDDRVKFVVQQYIKRTQDKYALADLYLPQLNMFIEINEPFHKDENGVLREIDRIRNEEIARVTHSAPIIIDCDNNIEAIHQQVTEVVNLIKQNIQERGADFRAWEGESSLSVDYHRKKGYLKVEDNEYVRTIDEAFAVFGTKAKHKGYYRAGGADIPGRENEIVWCPNSVHHIWSNILSDDGMVIREYNKKDETARKAHVEKFLKTNQKRATFFREEDDLGFKFYRFVGVFELDKKESMQENKCVWKRISDYYKLPE